MLNKTASELVHTGSVHWLPLSVGKHRVQVEARLLRTEEITWNDAMKSRWLNTLALLQYHILVNLRVFAFFNRFLTPMCEYIVSYLRQLFWEKSKGCAVYARSRVLFPSHVKVCNTS